MWTAFPSSDYYEDSVTIGVSPRRPSRVPLTLGYLLHYTQSVMKTWLVVLIVVLLVALVLVVALTLIGVTTKTEGGVEPSAQSVSPAVIDIGRSSAT